MGGDGCRQSDDGNVTRIRTANASLSHGRKAACVRQRRFDFGAFNCNYIKYYYIMNHEI